MLKLFKRKTEAEKAKEVAIKAKRKKLNKKIKRLQGEMKFQANLGNLSCVFYIGKLPLCNEEHIPEYMVDDVIAELTSPPMCYTVSVAPSLIPDTDCLIVKW
jgi:hypothetical protein